MGQFEYETLNYISTNFPDYANGLDKMKDAIQDLGYSSEDAFDKLKNLLEAVEKGDKLDAAIRRLFNPDEGTFNTLINAYEKAFTMTTSNLSQNLTAFQSQINSFYETATK